jgi:hypothetical protein
LDQEASPAAMFDDGAGKKHLVPELKLDGWNPIFQRSQ